jgi:carbon-monoxide dehydrogenase medium subunit
MYGFTYQRPTSLDAAVAARAAGSEARYLAGGMTLIPTLKQRLASPSDLIDLSAVPGLTGIENKGGKLVIGAMTRHAEVASSSVVKQAIPALAYLAAQIGDAQVRNRGTIGGSVANSDPAADYPAAVIALGASIVTNKRTIAADNYFKDLFTTALEDGELIRAIEFPIPKRAAYQKFPHPASRYAIAGVFVADTANGVRVGVTGAGPCAFRATAFEQALARKLDATSLDGVSVPYDRFNSDLAASAEFRGHLVGVLAKRAVGAL